MKSLLSFALCLLLTAACAGTAPADAAASKAVSAKAARTSPVKIDKYSFDPQHTQIVFSVDHLGFSQPSGRFTKFTGGFAFDAKHPENSWVDVTIDPASLDFASAEWEKAVKGADFLNTAKFKKIVFKSTKVEKTGKDKATVTGNLLLLGVKHPVTLDVTYNKSGINPYNKKFVAGFSATGTLNRSDFGMTYGLPGIGDAVTLAIQVEGNRREEKNAGRQAGGEVTAMQITNTLERYGVVTKTLHWVIALLIITLVCVGLYIAYLANIKQKFMLIPLHKEFGICVLALAVARVLWHGYSRTPHFVASLKNWEITGARIAHYYLYFAMFCMPLSGWIFSSAAGRTVSFFGFALPNLVAKDKGTQEIFADVHAVVGWSLVFVIGLHVAGALKHHFFDKDITLRRMLPFGMKNVQGEIKPGDIKT